MSQRYQNLSIELVRAAHPRWPMARLVAHPWPGNVRELENALERAVVMSRNPTVSVDDLPPAVAKLTAAPTQLIFEVGTSLKQMERRMIEATLKRVDGDKTRAARMLGTTTRTLYRREEEWRDRSS